MLVKQYIPVSKTELLHSLKILISSCANIRKRSLWWTTPQEKRCGHFPCHLGHMYRNFAICNGLFSLVSSFRSTNPMRWLACIGKLGTRKKQFTPSTCGKSLTFRGRYLQHIVNTLFQHIERIQSFTTRSFNQIGRPNPTQAAAFKKSFSFLSFTMLEASATQSLADSLSSVSPLIALATLSLTFTLN